MIVFDYKSHLLRIHECSAVAELNHFVFNLYDQWHLAVSIDEMLDGLPYKSRIMTITSDDWLRLSISEQQSLVNDLYDKLERYQRYNAATDLWVNYLGTEGAQNLLYPMLLDDLP